MKASLLLIACFFTTSLYAYTAIGLLQGEKDLVLKSKSQGELKILKLKEGDIVKSGDIIAVLDDKKEKLEKELAENEFNTAKQDYIKSKILKKYISKDELIKKKDNFIRKEIQFKLKKVNLEAKKIISPIDGVIARRMIKIGESISSGQEVFEVIDLEKLIIELDIDAKKTKKLKKGALLDFTSELHPKQTFSAEITYISQSLDKSSGTINVKLALKNTTPDGTYILKPGTMVKVQFD